MEYVIIFAGIALAVSPWVFGFSATSAAATWIALALGIVVLAAAGYRVVRKDERKWEDAVSLIAGLAAVLAPLAFRFPRNALWTGVVLGLIIVGAAAYQLFFAKPGAPAKPRAA